MRTVPVLAFAFVLGMLSHHVRADEEAFVPRQAMVRLRPAESIATFNARYGTTVLQAIPERGIFLLGLPAEPDENSFVALFDVDPAVLTADLNFIADDTDPGGSTQDIFLARTAEQYRTDPTAAMSGSGSSTSAARGAQTVVAVLDTGVDASHPLLLGRIAPGGYNLIDEGTDTGDDGTGRFRGHGTMAAGLVLRVAPEALILPLKVLDADGQTTTFRIARAIYMAIDAGANVINLSLGTQADPALLREAVAEAQTRGVIVVAAAGNENMESPPTAPAGMSAQGVIGVAATDTSCVKAPFSNYGSWVSISGPGVEVVGPVPGGGFAAANGTSYASPLVAGVAAAVRSVCPQADMATIRGYLLNGTSPIDALNPNYEGRLGAGCVNASRSVALALWSGQACRCPADFNGRDGVTVQDLFDYVEAWFSGSPISDVTLDGATTTQDLFSYLTFWFAGCP